MTKISNKLRKPPQKNTHTHFVIETLLKTLNNPLRFGRPFISLNRALRSVIFGFARFFPISTHLFSLSVQSIVQFKTSRPVCSPPIICHCKAASACLIASLDVWIVQTLESAAPFSLIAC